MKFGQKREILWATTFCKHLGHSPSFYWRNSWSYFWIPVQVTSAKYLGLPGEISCSTVPNTEFWMLFTIVDANPPFLVCLCNFDFDVSPLGNWQPLPALSFFHIFFPPDYPVQSRLPMISSQRGVFSHETDQDSSALVLSMANRWEHRFLLQ